MATTREPEPIRPGEAREFFDSSAVAWTHAGRAAERLLAAQVFRGTFVVRSDSVEHVGDFTAMVESFRRVSTRPSSNER